MLWGTMAVLKLVALSVALSNKTFIDKSNELVNRGDDSGLETLDNGEKDCKKEEREAKQLQFSRLMERYVPTNVVNLLRHHVLDSRLKANIIFCEKFLFKES